MLLTPQGFSERVTQALRDQKPIIAFDFETDALTARNGGKAFILGMATRQGKCSVWLDQAGIPDILRELFGCQHALYLAHNAKFEMDFLYNQWGIKIAGRVYDTMVMARVERNDHMNYSLQACSKRDLGLSKYLPALQWVKLHKGVSYKYMPSDVVIPYVEQDAALSLKLFDHQMEVFNGWERTTSVRIKPIITLELDTIKHLFDMEQRGLRLDQEYVYEALSHEERERDNDLRSFRDSIGVGFVDSPQNLVPILRRYGIPVGTTKKGNPSVDKKTLAAAADHDVVQRILRIRKNSKRLETYWKNFLALHIKGRIHSNVRQSGTIHGRFSVNNPASQTWPKRSETQADKYHVRRSFLADPGSYILSKDYSQMELRRICDEAKDIGMIEAFQQGIDFHQQTADDAGVARGLAKNGRFAKQYGAGPDKVASTLGISVELAKRIMDAIDAQSPRVAAYTRELITYAEQAPFGPNWLGRRYFFKQGREWLYPNYRISGGCSDILRIAICDIGDMLRAEVKGNTYMLLPIHDEILFNWDPVDDHLLPEVNRLMIKANRDKFMLDMEVSEAKGPNCYDLAQAS